MVEPGQYNTQYGHRSKALAELYNLIYSDVVGENGAERASTLQLHPWDWSSALIVRTQL